jgi:DnaJ-class molecular chaperone
MQDFLDPPELPRVCPECNGAGFIVVDDEIYTCPDCDGDREVPLNLRDS